MIKSQNTGGAQTQKVIQKETNRILLKSKYFGSMTKRAIQKEKNKIR